MDQSLAQKRNSHQWRCCKRDFETLAREDLTYDHPDRMVSIDHNAILQLDSGRLRENCCIVWLRTAADKAISIATQSSLEAAFAAELDKGPLRG